MNDQASEPGLYGTILRVSNLAAQRIFYRDTLGLGEPTMDSNFWVEFSLPGNGILVLEHSASVSVRNNGEHIDRMGWLLAVDDFAGRVQALKDKDVQVIHPPAELPGRQTATFADPEGNCFTLYHATPSA